MSTLTTDPVRRRLVRFAVAIATSVAAMLMATVSPAAAHVYVESAAANPDGTTTFTFGFDHGCVLSPTVELHVRLPTDAEVRGTTQPDGWHAAGEGGTVRWTGPPIPTGDLAIFTLTTTRFGYAGETVLFPAVQTCEEGEHAWISTDPDAAEPAPFVVLDAQTAQHPTPPTETSQPTSSSGNAARGATTSQVAIIVVVGMTAAAAIGALAGDRRTTGSSSTDEA